MSSLPSRTVQYHIESQYLWVIDSLGQEQYVPLEQMVISGQNSLIESMCAHIAEILGPDAPLHGTKTAYQITFEIDTNLLPNDVSAAEEEHF